tara:strand:+ start:2122 stop:3036 length:915 start_codon:yes stop_codon:yes gene_type:complete
MRIVLKKGVQKKLIESAKRDITWKELGNLLGICSGYLKNELRYEKRNLSEEVYKKLCRLSNCNLDKFIVEKLGDNWGRIKGGNFSSGNTKRFIEPKETEELAELSGAIIGDGHINKLKVGKKIRCYSIVIAGDSRNDKDYMSNYLPSLFFKLFGEKGSLAYSKDKNVMYAKIFGKRIIEFIEKKGIFSGNKKENSQSIPNWILKNNKYLRACLRGLIDTDGCIYYISKNNKNLRISFTSYIPKLLNEVRESFIKLGFHPSKIIVNKNICLSRKEDIKKFLSEIRFSNEKHLKRLQNLIKNASIV